MIRFLSSVTLIFLTAYAAPLIAGNVNQPVVEAGYKISYWYRNYDTQASYALLDMALSKTTDLYGAYEIVRSPVITQGRAVVELQNENLTNVRVMNVVPDLNRRDHLIPVRVAADEGLIGLRVCIINEKDQDRFKNIRSHQDIAEHGIIFGQGLHWPDTDILRANALSVVTSAQYENLYPMLENGRYHCFLRGINEVIDDLKAHPGRGLMVEPSLLFAYPSVSLFFVSKSDQALAVRLELGLRRAILDGSYAEYFVQEYAVDLAALNLDQRRVIRLNNPYMEDALLLNIKSKLIDPDGKL